MRKFWPRFLPRGATGVLAGLLLIGILVLQYAAGLFTMAMARISKERELDDHLHDLGALAPSLLGRSALSLADLSFDARWQESQQISAPSVTSATTARQFYRDRLDRDLTQAFDGFARWARLYKLVLLTPEGHVLYDTFQPERALEKYDFWEIDRAWLATALTGQAIVTPFYVAPPGRPIKRFYKPILEDSPSNQGQVRAIVCLVAGQDYLEGIAQLGGSLFRLNLILTVLMGLVGLLIFSLLRRQRHYERQVAEADRLAGLGTLAAGFAHELRNPLEIVRAFTEDLERSLRLGAPAEEALDACQEIIEEVDRMNRLVGQFLCYTRGQNDDGGAGVTGVLETTQSVLAMLRPSAEKARVTFAVEHPGAAAETAARWAVALDSGSFRQILINLTLNAIQASREGGQVTIGLQTAGRQVELHVQDQGAGVPDKDRHRIFEPFFSTRPAGSGLGLAISRQIADRAGGSLKLNESRAGAGACFVLTLPRAKAAETSINADCEVRNEE